MKNYLVKFYVGSELVCDKMTKADGEISAHVKAYYHLYVINPTKAVLVTRTTIHYMGECDVVSE